MEITTLEHQTDERLPWSRPSLERLTVNFDTANAGGSGGDFETMELVGA